MKIFPVHNAVNGVCGCGNPNCSNIAKHPCTINGLKDASDDIAKIASWEKTYPKHNIGIPTGAINGFFVVDVDFDKGGSDSYAELKLRGLPDTYTVETGSGLHLYYKYPSKEELQLHGLSGGIKNRVGVLPGIDIRGDGGYVIGPGSVHRNGKIYAVKCSGKIVPTSSTLLDQIKGPPASSDCPRIDVNGSGNGNVSFATKGERNDRLFRRARSLLAKGDPIEVVEKYVREIAKTCTPPFDDKNDNLEKLIKHIGSYENSSDFVPPPTITAQASVEIITAKDFMAIDTHETDWLVDSIIPDGGVTMFSAFQKTGKSTFTYQLLASLAKGEDFLGIKTLNRNVLLLAAEEPVATIQAKLEHNTLEAAENFYIMHGMGVSVDDEKIYERIMDACIAKQIGFIAFDPIGLFLRLENENDNAEISRKLVPILALRERTNAGILLIHHTRKASGGDPTKAFRGAGSWTACVDQYLSMSSKAISAYDENEDDEEEDEDIEDTFQTPTKRTLHVVGRYDSIKKYKLDFDMITRKYKVTDKHKNLQKHCRMRQIYGMLKASATLTFSDMLALNVAPRMSLSRYLTEMQEKEFVEKTENGWKIGKKTP